MKFDIIHNFLYRSQKDYLSDRIQDAMLSNLKEMAEQLKHMFEGMVEIETQIHDDSGYDMSYQKSGLLLRFTNTKGQRYWGIGFSKSGKQCYLLTSTERIDFTLPPKGTSNDSFSYDERFLFESNKIASLVENIMKVEAPMME